MKTNIWDALIEFHSAFSLPIDSIEIDHLKESEEFKMTMDAIWHHCEELAKMEIKTARGLRIKLLAEEFAEYIHGERMSNKLEIADALTDIHYIGAGTEVAYGIPGSATFSHIHDTNMAKLGLDGKPIYREDGKVMKPEDWTPPDLSQFL